MIWILVVVLVGGLTVLGVHEFLAIDDRPLLQSMIFYFALICFGFVIAAAIFTS
jgi:hypothetical protein